MKRYDPNQSPDPSQWLALDEAARAALAAEHHRTARIKLPNAQAHALFHVIVENQIAENIESVVRTVARLQTEGLDRHEAIHAVGSVLAGHLRDLFKSDEKAADSQAIYYAAVERLTAAGWRNR